jgi:hypothetical protein
MAFRAANSGARCGDSRKSNWRQSGEAANRMWPQSDKFAAQITPIPGNYDDPNVRNTVTT